MPATGHGATFSFNGSTADVASIDVRAPKARLTNMTGGAHLTGATVMTETGECESPGTITVEFVASPGADPQGFVHQRGQLSFSSPEFSITRNVVCDSASISARTGEIVRGTLTFVMTDYYE